MPVVIFIFLLCCLCWQNRTAFISKNAPSNRSHIDSFKKSPYSPRDGVVGTRRQVSIGDTCTAGVEFLIKLDYSPSVPEQVTNLALKVTED